MKKYLTLLSICSILALSACGGDSDTNGAGGNVGNQPDSGMQSDTTGGDTSCEPQQLARSTIGPIDKVSEGTVQKTGNTLEVDASAGGRMNASNNPYIYVDLDSASKVEASDSEAFTNQKWDIALKRTVIRSNSAHSGSGSVSVATRDAENLSDVTEVPSSNEFRTDDFVQDCEAITNRSGDPKTAFSTWYNYDFQTHEVTPKAKIYVVETTEEAFFKIDLKSYSGGTVTFEYEEMNSGQ